MDCISRVHEHKTVKNVNLTLVNFINKSLNKEEVDYLISIDTKILEKCFMKDSDDTYFNQFSKEINKFIVIYEEQKSSISD